MLINLFRNGFLRISFLFVLMLSCAAFAKPFQIHNTGRYHFKSDLLVFTGDGPRVYLIKNRTNSSVLVNRKIRKNPGASAGWASMISAGKWSALMLNRRPFMMYCIVIQKNQAYQKIDCEHVLVIKVVQNFRAQSASIIKNSYWLAENQPYYKLLKSLRKRGILF